MRGRCVVAAFEADIQCIGVCPTAGIVATFTPVKALFKARVASLGVR